MKPFVAIYHLFPVVCMILFLIGCGSGREATGGGNEGSRYGTTVVVDDHSTTLDTYIGRLSGVRVSGSGAGAMINIRGAGSVQRDTRPLFVIDGSRIGRDFSQIYNLVRIENVHSVRVLTLRRATTLYGSEGNSGAIEILTHAGQEQ